MSSRKSLLTVPAAILSLLNPAGALAQSAGDDQYTDPFGDTTTTQTPPEQPSSSPTPADTGNPAPPESEPQPSATSAQDTVGSGDALPRTGPPALSLGGGGLLLLLAGAVLRRLARQRRGKASTFSRSASPAS